MRITRLYYHDTLTVNTRIELDSTASAHLVRVLRARPGTQIILFNGNGKQYLAQTCNSDPRKTSVEIISEEIINRESPISIRLVQGISRNDRMELCIQKATELGADRIIPVQCKRSNLKLNDDRLKKKQIHWQNVAISACEQSGRNSIPDVEQIQSLSTCLKTTENQPNKLFLDPEADMSLHDVQLNKADTQITVFIGPEGGIDSNEIYLLKETGWTGVKTGPRIMRTETAGPAVIAALQTLYGDF